MNKITVTHSISIQASPEKVWDYTQDWNRRSEWDRSVKSAEYVSRDPIRVKVVGRGGVLFQVTYKFTDRPRLTTLLMSELNSLLVKGGGGSWKYEEEDGGTRWTQNNTLILYDGVLGKLFRPVANLMLSRLTRSMMTKAKFKIERSSL